MIWDHLAGSTSALKVMLPPQLYSFLFLPSFWFTVYSLSQEVSGDMGLHRQNTSMWVSCGLMHFIKNVLYCHGPWSSGPEFAPRSESCLHISQSISFSRTVGICIKTSQHHLPVFSFLWLLLKIRTAGTAWWPLFLRSPLQAEGPENNPERGWKMDVFWIEKSFHFSLKSNVSSFVFIY